MGLFAVFGFPFAITLTVPYVVMAEANGGGGLGFGLAMGVLNIAIVVPQLIVTVSSGPWDAVFGGGNMAAFMGAAVFGLGAAVLAVWKLPRSSNSSRQCSGGCV